jgi:ABC-type Mn2+/Zn2+ transport system permease subunit
MLWVSVAAAVGATVGGLFLSLALDWPSGATVVLVLGLVFFASQALLFRPRRGAA